MSKETDISLRIGSQHMDAEQVEEMLRTTTWGKGIYRDIVETSIRNSLCGGHFHQKKQISFARFITDKATFAYLADVYVTPEFRKRGLAQELIQALLELPELKTVRRYMLSTKDAHGLYSKFQFNPIAEPEFLMERRGFSYPQSPTD